MKPFYFLKIWGYRVFCTPVGKFLTKILAPSISAKNLEGRSSCDKKDFLIAITIDTESGYVKNNEQRVWQYDKPEAFIGFSKGVENWRKLFDRYSIKGTFLLSTQCFDAKKSELKDIIDELKKLDKEKHEIGLHLHPNSDFALQKLLKNDFEYVSAKFYDYNKIRAMLDGSKNLIEENLGKSILGKMASFRWGNWGLNSTAARALNESGFEVDSSAVPGIKGHLNDIMHYDWSEVSNHYPWKLSMENHQDTRREDLTILEIPIATFNFLGFGIRADPVYSQLLIEGFEHYYKNADRSKPFIFVMMSHSSEGTYKNGKATNVIKQTEHFIRHVKNYGDVKFVTLKEGAISLKQSQSNM